MNATKAKYRRRTNTLTQVGSQVGNTPLIYFEELSADNVKVFAKAEWAQLSGSIKARAAFNIMATAIREGSLTKDKVLLDASSGNTAIAYGTIGKDLGIDVTVCLPSNASARRIEMLQDLGVTIEFTSPFEGTEGAQAVARAMYSARPDIYFYADQYSNTANWQAHYIGTGPEIIQQTSAEVTHFVAGLGTTGTFTGTTRYLRESADICCIGLQPDSALHILEGWKHLETADVPSIYDDTLADRIELISSEETIDMMLRINESRGLRLSPSSAANLAGAKKIAGQIAEGVVVTVLPDSIDRYRELEKEVFGR